MDELNQWCPQPELFQEYEEELASLYQQEQMQQQLAEEQQHHTPSVPLPPTEPNNPFGPSHRQYSSSFPRSGGQALPNLSFGVMAEQASSSILSFSGQQTGMLTFSGGGCPDAGTEGTQAPERRSRTHLNTREHVIAERRRREKMQQQFMALASTVPDLTKTDKVTLLDSTIKYVKHLEEKIKTLEAQYARRTSVSTILGSKRNISADEGASGFCRSGSCVAGESIPTIETTVHGETVLLKICCKEKRGVLVMLISELENQAMSITNINVVPFADICLNITITAETGEGFSTTAELVKNLSAVLRSFT